MSPHVCLFEKCFHFHHSILPLPYNHNFISFCQITFSFFRVPTYFSQQSRPILVYGRCSSANATSFFQNNIHTITGSLSLLFLSTIYSRIYCNTSCYSETKLAGPSPLILGKVEIRLTIPHNANRSMTNAPIDLEMTLAIPGKCWKN